LGREAADLELHAGESTLEQLLDLGGDVGVRAVVAADRDHRDAVAVAAPEAPQRLTVRLADEVPDGRVHAGARDEAEAAVAEDVVGRRARELPAAFDGERVLSEEPRRDLLANDAVDSPERLVLVAGIGLADEPVVRRDA